MRHDGGRPMRVLQVCARYLPEMGGIETHVDQVTRRVAGQHDLAPTVLTTDRTGRLPRRESREGFEVIRVRAWPRNRDYYLAPGIYSAVRSGNWDLVHCQGIHTPVPLLAMVAARRAGVPYIVSFHTGGHSSAIRASARSLQWKVAGPLLRSAAHLVGVSRYEARLIQQHARTNPARMSVIRNGGGLAIHRGSGTVAPGRILSVGRLERYKGHHRVIEALAHLVKRRPDSHLEIIGAGPYEADLGRIADRHGLADRVTIRHIPPADRQGMAETLRRAEVVAAFSDYEAHPVAVMEALTAGRPVVGYDTAGMADLVEDGYVRGIPPGTPPAAAARALEEAMAATPAQLTELPTWDSCAESLLSVYRSVLRRERSVHTQGPR
jgi:glycosyltransferase involved in cell wall biosynthesis